MPAVASEPVAVGPRRLGGALDVPEGAHALVVFAHGSGSSRSSPRNRFVAERLHRRGLGTLLFDLLDEDEAQDRRNVFDVERLGARLVEAIDWLADGSVTPLGARPLGLFGASTGAAAAFVAAALRPARVAAVVSRGGRGDLASAVLPAVRAPTLLIVGGADTEVLALNRAVLRALPHGARLDVVPGATHLFEEPGALDVVADAAARWFAGHTTPPGGAR